MPDDADQGVRHLVLVHGRAKARTMVEPAQKRLVDIAAEVLSDEDGKIGISYSGFCLTGLPHKQLPEDQAWEKCQRHRKLGAPRRSKIGARHRLCGARWGGGYWAAGGSASAGEPAICRRRLLCARR
jgi:hypothetical protein